MKVSSSVKLKPLSYLKDGSYIAEVSGKIEDPSRSSGQYKRYRKEKMLVRVIEYKIRGFPPTRLITNLLDPAISAKELVLQYHQRWEMEVGYFEIKTVQCATLRGQTPTIFRSKTPLLVKQELYAVLIMYNTLRYVMSQAAQTQGLDPRRISFLETLQWVMDVSPVLFGKSSKQKQEIKVYLQSLIAQSLVDRPRRERINPRVIKQRSSSFPLKKGSQKGESFKLDQELQIIQQEGPVPLHSGEPLPETKIIPIKSKPMEQPKKQKLQFFKRVVDFIRKKAA